MIPRLIYLALLPAILTALPAAAQPAVEIPPPPPAAIAPPPVVDHRAPTQKAFDRVIPALVSLDITVLEDPIGAYERRAAAETVFDEFVRSSIPLRIAGLRISPKGEILARDPNLPLQRYGKIEIHGHDGNITRAKIAAVLANHDAIIIAPENTPAEPLPWVKFANADIRPGDRFYMAVPSIVEKRLCLEIQSHNAAGTLANQSAGQVERLWIRRNFAGQKVAEVIPTTAPVILNHNAEIVGLALDDALWQTPDGRSSWIGANILADTRLSPDQLDTIATRIRKTTADCIRNVQIEFRPDSPINQKAPLEQGKLHLFALILDRKGTLFLPTDFSRDVISQIADFTVQEDSRTHKATFLGVFRKFGGILLRAPGISGKPIETLALDPIPRGAIFHTLSVTRRFGGRYDKIAYTRCLDFQLGYKDNLSPLSRKPLSVGDFLVDDNGRFIAFYAPLKRDTRDQLHARIVRGSRRSAVQNQLFRFAEIAVELADPPSHFDPDIRPKSRHEEQRFVWLGIEYQPMDAPLARIFQAETPTRNGGRGLLVKHVYPQSPAQRIGIETGDILLALQIPGAAREFDLAPTGKWRSVYFAPHPVDNRIQRLWRPRINYLTSLLRYIGQEQTITLRRIHKGEQSLISCKLEKAPDDFDTAEPYKDNTLGLTVKQLTYEVRHVLRLPNDAPGVVITKTEPGGKANLAQILPYEIITTINDKPVYTPDDFQKAIRAGADRVELLITYLGQSRIVEIEFTRNPED